ncbi:MAG: DUF4869 domain-containing protein [Lachnospiraceae bacterium]
MLRLFLNKAVADKVSLNDVYFNKYTFRKLDYTTASKIIQMIDGVQLTDEMKIISKFTDGAMDLTKLSTGCKTVLNIWYNQDTVFDISECGKNALSVIYKQSVGCAYAKDLVTSLRNDLDCDIEVVSPYGTKKFTKVSKMRDWYSEVCANADETCCS